MTIDAIRTLIGKCKPGGALSVIHPVDLHAHAIRAPIDRVGIDPKLIADVISGAAGQVGERSLNTARSAVLAAGLPESVPAATIDRQRGTSQQAISFAAQGVIGGAYYVVIAPGIESMSRVPIGSQVAGRTRSARESPSVTPTDSCLRHQRRAHRRPAGSSLASNSIASRPRATGARPQHGTTDASTASLHRGRAAGR